jgi:hypothetical protein
MQFLDIYQEDELFLRIPLGETDLMEMVTRNWDEDVVKRERIVRFMIRQLMNNRLVTCIKRAEYYLVFESKMNNYLADGRTTIEPSCDAPFVLTNSIEQ